MYNKWLQKNLSIEYNYIVKGSFAWRYCHIKYWLFSVSRGDVTNQRCRKTGWNHAWPLRSHPLSWDRDPCAAVRAQYVIHNLYCAMLQQLFRQQCLTYFDVPKDFQCIVAIKAFLNSAHLYEQFILCVIFNWQVNCRARVSFA